MIDNMTRNEFKSDNIDNKDESNKVDSAPLAIRSRTKKRLVKYIESLYPRPILIDMASLLIDKALDGLNFPKNPGS